MLEVSRDVCHAEHAILIWHPQNRHQEYLIRVSLRYENVGDAVIHALALLRKVYNDSFLTLLAYQTLISV